MKITKRQLRQIIKEELDAIKDSPAGKEYTKMIEDAKSEIESYTLSL